jgi:hypothetical protein
MTACVRHWDGRPAAFLIWGLQLHSINLSENIWKTPREVTQQTVRIWKVSFNNLVVCLPRKIDSTHSFRQTCAAAILQPLVLATVATFRAPSATEVLESSVLVHRRLSEIPVHYYLYCCNNCPAFGLGWFCRLPTIFTMSQTCLIRILVLLQCAICSYSKGRVSYSAFS